MRTKFIRVETVSQVTEDGGKTWQPVGNNKRHVDDHAMWIDPADTKHFLIGGDGGVYETSTAEKNIVFKSNLPLPSFTGYRLIIHCRFIMFTAEPRTTTAWAAVTQYQRIRSAYRRLVCHQRR